MEGPIWCPSKSSENGVESVGGWGMVSSGMSAPLMKGPGVYIYGKRVWFLRVQNKLFLNIKRSSYRCGCSRYTIREIKWAYVYTYAYVAV